MPPNPPPLFGRDPDLAALTLRAARPGLTILTARAQMGKSALLAALDRRLSHPPAAPPPVAPPPAPPFAVPPLIGFAEASGETADLLLRSVADLYTRWIKSSTFTDQARVLATQQSRDLIGRAGKAAGSLFKALAAKPLEAVGELVKSTMDGLADANRELKDGVTLPRLQLDDARDLLTLVHRVTGRPLVLLLDQWEDSPHPAQELVNLRSFLNHLDDWPPCHFVLGIRADTSPLADLALLAKAFDPLASLYDLPPMHLDSPDAAAPLLAYLHDAVPATASLPDADLLNLIDGYPGTVVRWVRTQKFDPVPDAAALARLAADANLYRFDEFNTFLPALSDAARTLVVRLSLLPATASVEGWRLLGPLALHDQPLALLDEPRRHHVLETAIPPSFGHPKRSDALRAWVRSNATAELTSLATSLFPLLAGLVRADLPAFTVAATSLGAQRDLARELDLPPLHLALCEAAASLAAARPIEIPFLLGFMSSASSAAVPASAAPLLAYGMLNAFNQAADRLQSASTQPVQDTARVDAANILAALRRLCAAFPADPVVRDQFASVLFNDASDRANEGRFPESSTSLQELSSLQQTFPSAGNVLDTLSKALFNFLCAAAEIAGAPPVDVPLGLLRQLHQANPASPVVRQSYGKALATAMRQAHHLHLPDLRDLHRRALSSLARDFPADPDLAVEYALSLHNVIAFSLADAGIDRVSAVAELKALAEAFPTLTPVQDFAAQLPPEPPSQTPQNT